VSARPARLPWPLRCRERRGLLRGLALGAASLSVAPAVTSADTGTGASGALWPALELIDGSRLDPASLKDLAVVLVVWATYCPFCRRHNARLDRLHRSLAGRPMRVITAATDRDAAVVRRYMADQGFTFPVTLEAERLRRQFELRPVIPMTCTFDRDGRLLQRIPGEMSDDDVLSLARLSDA